MLTNILLAAVWAVFAIQNLMRYLETHDPILLAFFCYETLYLFFFLFRTSARATSFKPADWIPALIATYVAFLFIPGQATALGQIGRTLFWIGIGAEFLSVASLNRSLAIVPARRQVKTSGMYQFVRHPMYLAHTLIYIGYLLAYFSIWNLAIFAVYFVCMILRIFNEERYLSEDEEYVLYLGRVRWRLLPFVY